MGIRIFGRVMVTGAHFRLLSWFFDYWSKICFRCQSLRRIRLFSQIVLSARFSAIVVDFSDFVCVFLVSTAQNWDKLVLQNLSNFCLENYCSCWAWIMTCSDDKFLSLFEFAANSQMQFFAKSRKFDKLLGNSNPHRNFIRVRVVKIQRFFMWTLWRPKQPKCLPNTAVCGGRGVLKPL
jgi:hypothetical protein